MLFAKPKEYMRARVSVFHVWRLNQSRYRLSQPTWRRPLNCVISQPQKSADECFCKWSGFFTRFRFMRMRVWAWIQVAWTVKKCCFAFLEFTSSVIFLHSRDSIFINCALFLCLFSSLLLFFFSNIERLNMKRY